MVFILYIFILISVLSFHIVYLLLRWQYGTNFIRTKDSVGTRHLTIIYLDGDYKVAQYGQWDGYPSYTGQSIVDMLKGINLEIFALAVRNVEEISQEQVMKLWQDLGADDSGFVSMDISSQFADLHPELHRNTGCDIIEIIKETGGRIKIAKELEFAADSLFCEWAYVIDLDSGELEVYEGFNTEPLTENERFYFLQEISLELPHRDKTFYPVKFLTKFPLNNLPEDIEYAIYGDEPEGEE